MAEPRIYSASCSTCSVGVTSDAAGVARWLGAHVERPDLVDSVRRLLEAHRWTETSVGVSSEFGHVVEVRPVGQRAARVRILDGHPGDTTREAF